jgi:hypothetical protein
MNILIELSGLQVNNSISKAVDGGAVDGGAVDEGVVDGGAVDREAGDAGNSEVDM